MPFCWQKLKIIRPESQPDLCRLVGSALIYPSWKSDVWQHTAGRKLVHLQHTQAALEGAVLLQQGPCTNFSLPYSIWPKLHLHPLYEEMAKFILRDRQTVFSLLLTSTYLHGHCPEIASARPFQDELPWHPTFNSTRFPRRIPSEHRMKRFFYKCFSPTLFTQKELSVHRNFEPEKMQDQIHWSKFMSWNISKFMPHKLMWKGCMSFG